MIPRGFVLVPVIPTERMLNEFSGVWWPNLGMNELRQWTKEKRLLEEKAYAAMIAVAPSAPVEDSSQLQAMQSQLRHLCKELAKSKAETRKAYKKLEYAWGKIRALEAQNDAGT